MSRMMRDHLGIDNYYERIVAIGRFERKRGQTRKTKISRKMYIMYHTLSFIPIYRFEALNSVHIKVIVVTWQTSVGVVMINIYSLSVVWMLLYCYGNEFQVGKTFKKVCWVFFFLLFYNGIGQKKNVGLLIICCVKFALLIISIVFFPALFFIISMT